MYVIPKKYGKRLYWTSYISLGTSLFSVYKNKLYILPIPLSVFLTSVNYWRNPIYGWRRNIDITTVCISGLSKLYIARNNIYNKEIYLLFNIGIFLYLIARFMVQDPNISTMTHCMMHIVGNISVFILIYGTNYQ